MCASLERIGSELVVVVGRVEVVDPGLGRGGLGRLGLRAADGATEERLLDLPTDCRSFDLAPDGRTVICDLDESLLDVRVIEGLDPAGS